MTKSKKLQKILKKLKRVVIAYSGGLDSTFLLKMAVDTMGKENVLAVTARSETYPHSEYKEAKRLAREIGAHHITIRTSELEIPNFKQNPVDRCYYCKRELFRKLGGIKAGYKMRYVLDGTNHDDLKDIRHGRKAAGELGVRSPLLEAGLTKDDIRKFSKRLKLPTWDKPSFACLASRFPFHRDITRDDLARIDKAENFLRGLGLKQIRLRLHGPIARLEVYESDFKKALKLKDAIIKRLKTLGFRYISLDLEGYRTGSMHEVV